MGQLKFIGHRGSGSCALCGKQSSDLVSATHDESIKRVWICTGCQVKILPPTDEELFSRLMRMLV
jgi:hypothetical protein